MLRYFQRERTYLNEAAKEFARAHPRHARHLQIESEADPDPYVERLFEGFAFLAGRIHERLDDDFPEFTGYLLDLLYPHLLKPIPSLTMIEVSPDPSIEESILLPRLTEIRSQTTGGSGARYSFMTTRDVRLSPVSIAGIEHRSGRELGSRCRISFKLESGSLSQIQLFPLRLQFTGQLSKALAAYLQFASKTKKVDVVVGGDDGNVVATLSGRDRIIPGGFGSSEYALPRSSGDALREDERGGSSLGALAGSDPYAACRLLQEYMVFPEKFLCIDVAGVEFSDQDADQFSLEFFFSDEFEEHEVPDEKNVKLHCTPAVNLFQCSGEVFKLDHEQTDYRVVPDRRRKNASVYEMIEVTGLDQKTGKRQAYRSAHSLGSQELPRYVSRTYALDPQQPSVFVSFPDTDPDSAFETVTTDLLCTNAGFARQDIAEAALNEVYPEEPSVESVQNLTRPTNYYPPPRSSDYLWHLLGHQVLSRTTFANRDALVRLLKAYDWTGDDVVSGRIDSILDASSQRKELPVRGAIVRGAEIRLKLDQRGFRHDAEVLLFGEVLSRVMSHYTTINSFLHLVVELSPSGKEFRWQPAAGTRPPI